MDKYIYFIENILKNKNIDNEGADWKQNEKLKQILNKSNIDYITDSFTLGINTDELMLFINFKSNMIDDNNIKKLKEDICENIKTIYDKHNKKFNVINFIFFVSTIEIRLKIKEAFLRKNANELIDKIKSEVKTKSLTLNSFFYLDKVITKEEIKLPNIKRYEMVTFPAFELDLNIPKDKKEVALKGYVFTADLYDLVDIYNKLGDQLFEKNVRLGIDDKLDVDKSIKETLKENPEAFWFRNNGITILVNEEQMKLDRVGEIVLKTANNSKLQFSVINGAQTITAAAEYYYSNTDIENKEKNRIAKVIVKIIHIRDGNLEEAKNISISLNRQKPIKAEDIAFTNEFVEKMNHYLEKAKEKYKLVRRGEESLTENAYSLISFAKARKACSGDPGSARNNATSTLLKISSETSQFCDEDIFKTEWYSASEKNMQECYSKFYSPVLFAMKMYVQCQSLSNKIKLNNSAENVVKNGVWYFIAFVIYILNDGNDEDYSNFRYTIDDNLQKELKELYEEFAVLYCKTISSNESDTGSNAFKKSENYEKLKASEYKETVFYKNVCKTFKKANNNI